ncbi:MAG: hypothetical protein ACXAC7_20300, partial [Candidatus Hodarchaeales archaeon]
IAENLHKYYLEFDVILSHIVIHNVVDYLTVIKQMTKSIKKHGYVVCIEPLPTGRHYYPETKVQKAMDLIEEVKIYRSEQRNEGLEYQTTRKNPWTNNYPSLFEKAGLKNIQAYGWTSVFTLSDNRYDYNDRKRWIKLRIKLFKDQQKEFTNILLKRRKSMMEISEAYRIIYEYFNTLNSATEDELNHLHEQEISHRIICIGQVK